MREPTRPDEPTGAVPSGRGLTTTLNYVLILVIVALLVTGLLNGVGGFVLDQEERAVATQLETAGNRLAGDLQTATTLVETAGDDTTVRLRSRLPETVAGSQYRIAVSGSGPKYELVLTATEPDVRATVVFRSSLDVHIDGGTLSGGELVVEYNSGRLEVSGRD